jgi:hypothetical protein
MSAVMGNTSVPPFTGWSVLDVEEELVVEEGGALEVEELGLGGVLELELG